MSDQITKNPTPTPTSDTDIKEENKRREAAIREFQGKSSEQIRKSIQCSLDPAVGRVVKPPKATALYVHHKWLVAPADRKEYDALMRHVFWWGYNAEIFKKLKAMAPRGSDYLRAIVGRAANWACIPPEMLAAVLQNENSPKAKAWHRELQHAERNLQALVGKGSTGFGNVKPETLKDVSKQFRTYYKSSVLRPGVKGFGQNKRVENDIYHAAAVVRHGLNLAWSAGSRSLNKALSSKLTYYPYFGGTVTQDVATRAMGHYNGMGDGALKYGEFAMKRLQGQKLHFMPSVVLSR